MKNCNGILKFLTNNVWRLIECAAFFQEGERCKTNVLGYNSSFARNCSCKLWIRKVKLMTWRSLLKLTTGDNSGSWEFCVWKRWKSAITVRALLQVVGLIAVNNGQRIKGNTILGMMVSQLLQKFISIEFWLPFRFH